MIKFGQSITTTNQKQPDGTWTVQRYGFDTGTRTYKLDSSRALSKLPQVGSADLTYPRMFVTTVQIVKGKAQITTATVSYEGLINRTKRDHFETSTEVEVFSDVPTVTGYTINAAVRWTRSLPRVTHVYVSEKYPNPLEVGTGKTPPKYAGNVAKHYAETWRPNFITIFRGWMLKSRSVRESGPLFEVTDTYGYTINEVKTS